MSYFDDGDKIYTLGFTYFPLLCGIAESFSFQVPSKYYLTCLTDSEFEYITFDDLQNIIDQSQQIERLFRRMTEAMFSSMIDLHIELRAMTIQERYKNFCQKNPQLLHMVPHKYISSYLGIDPTNFSKLFNSVPI
ncbi:Crp/Fnr family transcriptional regulator [Algoriphagus terrigena]|uniref:Crp/Fnr family transcriptional regulator n=1 Tax=Algoriphagus terrigena TaxID=344884 RepID=UPI001FDEAE9D|nr:Crp/Fnr family transcriptional regulator [Algoriphagus terrigena]